jgi:hypothetical protein
LSPIDDFSYCLYSINYESMLLIHATTRENTYANFLAQSSQDVLCKGQRHCID